MTKQQRMADRQKAFQAKYKMTIEKENEDNAKVNDMRWPITNTTPSTNIIQCAHTICESVCVREFGRLKRPISDDDNHDDRDDGDANTLMIM